MARYSDNGKRDEMQGIKTEREATRRRDILRLLDIVGQKTETSRRAILQRRKGTKPEQWAKSVLSACLHQLGFSRREEQTFLDLSERCVFTRREQAESLYKHSFAFRATLNAVLSLYRQESNQ